MLYVVAGPIGNLGDITLRALETLKSVDLIISEDTRETQKVLQHYNISTPQISYRDQNHLRVLPTILQILDQGKSVALVSDSGTPLISDPGFKLIEFLQAKSYEIHCIPGPSSVIAALSISSLPTDKFVFLGFLPKSANQRKKLLEQYGALDATLTIFESPYRVIRLLDEIMQVLGDRKVCLVKDLTKIHEKVICQKASSFLAAKHDIKEKGEYIVLIAKNHGF